MEDWCDEENETPETPASPPKEKPTSPAKDQDAVKKEKKA
jgi:hypothetical protein